MIRWRRLGLALLVCELALGVSQASAGGKISIDETKWISLGAGGRTSFGGKEDSSPDADNWSRDFNIDNARIYISGQVHEYLKFELNTDCAFCGNSGLEEFVLLDAIAKIELNSYFNIWAGRLLVPAERQELNGPFYSSTYDAYKTPFYSSDFSVDFGSGGAGVYARDHGANIWGAAGPGGALQYVGGVFAGLQSGANKDDNPLLAARVAYNFLEVEKNPGYYTSGTYYGTGGNILTLGLAAQYQEDGSGSSNNPGDFFGLSSDLLFEMPTAAGAITFNGEFKHFSADYDSDAFADPDNFGMFDGDAFSVAGLYLFPQTVGIGKFQPYARYTGVYPDDSSDRDELELGLNYIIDGHNARISLFYQYGDIATKGLNYSSTASGDDIHAVRLGVQLQI
ncbi:MAG TPA: hypothetical protein VEB21_13580 [Terriglobales bacterium]|nr:hypothetical protein [Terriglobales bacterium]